ncbi:MAG: hypothetical protein WC614_06975 [bacterium]
MELKIKDFLQLKEEEVFLALEKTSEEKDRTYYANLLRTVITPEQAILWLQKWDSVDFDLVKRVIWALGETHNSKVASIIYPYIEHKDEQIAGVAISALLKTNPKKLREIISKLPLPKSSEMQKRIEYAKRIVENGGKNNCSITILKVEDLENVHEIWDSFLTDGYSSGEICSIECYQRYVPAVVGNLAGLWHTYLIPITGNLASIALWEIGKMLINTLKKLVDKKERVDIDLDTAVLLARATLDKTIAENVEIARAVEICDFLYEEYRYIEARFLVEFSDSKNNYKVVLASDGKIVSSILDKK